MIVLILAGFGDLDVHIIPQLNLTSYTAVEPDDTSCAILKKRVQGMAKDTKVCI